jgi:thiamine biosynthesis lipoprotein
MKKTQIIMGMPITVEIVDAVNTETIDSVFNYFKVIDEQFSTYKPSSEISKINAGLPENEWSESMRLIIDLCEQTKKQSSGYFDIYYQGKFDPSGLVKGWSVNNAAQILRKTGVKNFYIEAGGDTQVSGMNAVGQPWAIGIRNPFKIDEIIKVIQLTDQGMATSGTYIRGQHIYNPHNHDQEINDIKSLTVIGENVYEADRFATAAFAMGKGGINFIEQMPGLEGYMVDSDKNATFTTGFKEFVVNNA